MEDKFKNKELANLIAVSHERLKELAAINQTVSIIKEGKSINETLQKICNMLPKAWQYPEYSMAKIIFDDFECISYTNFSPSKWKQVQPFNTIDNKKGYIEISYSKEFPNEDEGPFLKEERDLLLNLANIITGYINSEKGKKLLTLENIDDNKFDKKNNIKKLNNSYNLLHRFLNKINADKDIYHDLMPFKIKEILLVSTLYNAFNLELEGSLSNDVLNKSNQINLSIPRITGVSTYEEAIEQLNYKHFDLIVIMVGVDKKAPFILSEKIKYHFKYIPVYLLLNYSSEQKYIEKYIKGHIYFDRIFSWDGNSKVFYAMVKHLEDISNAENDTNIGLVNVILLVEDTPEYYSKYLPVLYDNLVLQTKKLIDKENIDDIYKLYRLRTRPKVLLATNYSEATYLYNKYKKNILCVISDVELGAEESMKTAGLDFIQNIRNAGDNIPVLINSLEDLHQTKAFQLNAMFINKNSNTLFQDINSFVNHQLGFEDFIFKTIKGKKIKTANSLKEFVLKLKDIPEESLIYHSNNFHFSSWLRARGEIDIARQIHKLCINDFSSINEYREYIIELIEQNLHKNESGRIVGFDKKALLDNSNIVNVTDGLLGGKGRGIAFINTLINNLDFTNIVNGINITFPRTAIIGTEEFDLFLKRNNIKNKINTDLTDIEIKKIFKNGILSNKLTKRLKVIVTAIDKPLAFRSSGLLEDSINQPFAGIFETYLLPNNHKNIDKRVEQASDAIKLVFASVFTKVAKSYLKAINSKIEGEHMAVIVQEVVGNKYDNYFYPHISGVAQSYNYYPISHMNPEDGFAILAVGLGKYVVEGEKTFRFSPKFPDIEINSLKNQINNSQTEFYAIDLNKSDINLLEGENAGLARMEISESEKHLTLKHLASVYDVDNDRIKPGITAAGPRVVNFANILKYKYIPLAETIDVVLKIVEEALGCPSEIEFAVDLNKDKNNKATFHLLQIKPLVANINNFKIDTNEIFADDTILYAEKGMGNGLIEDITDVIYISPDNFDKMNTEEMAKEIEYLNDIMIQENKKYVLIGTGRWGTRDKWIGVPVNWPQISNANVIIEYSLENFPLDASLGSHFFHNVTANNIGYFSVFHETKSYIKWNVLEKQKVINKTKYFNHIQFKKPLSIKIDGKERIALITLN